MPPPPMSNSVKGILVVGMRSASYLTLEKYVCSSTVQYKARPKISDKRRLQHSISAIFFSRPQSCAGVMPLDVFGCPLHSLSKQCRRPWGENVLHRIIMTSVLIFMSLPLAVLGFFR